MSKIVMYEENENNMEQEFDENAEVDEDERWKIVMYEEIQMIEKNVGNPT